jgi:hypothetical protein
MRRRPSELLTIVGVKLCLKKEPGRRRRFDDSSIYALSSISLNFAAL